MLTTYLVTHTNPYELHMSICRVRGAVGSIVNLRYDNLIEIIIIPFPYSDFIGVLCQYVLLYEEFV
jgi:hypothetical protein